MTEPAKTEFKPPYLSFQTFWNFIGELGNKPLPPAIDRSLMSNKSGTDQANLTAALIAFGLIDQGGNVSQRLKDLVTADEAGRKQILAAMVSEFYPGPAAISAANSTEAALHESFKDNYNLTAAETRRKCETFFLHALRVAGLPVSPHFKQTRPGSGAPGAPRKAQAQRRKDNSDSAQGGNPPPQPSTPQNGTAEIVTVDFGEAGRVVLHVEVRWLQLDDDTFTELRKNVNAMKALAVKAPANSAGEDDNDREGASAL